MSNPDRLYIVTHRDGTHERLIAAQDANHVRQFVTIVRKAKPEDVARILIGGGKIEHADASASPHPDQGELALVDPLDEPERIAVDAPAPVISIAGMTTVRSIDGQGAPWPDPSERA